METADQIFSRPSNSRFFETLPADAINLNIADTFVPLGEDPERRSGRPNSAPALRERFLPAGRRTNRLPEAKRAFSVERDGVRFSAWDFTSQHDVPLRLYLLENATTETPEQLHSTCSINPAGRTGWPA